MPIQSDNLSVSASSVNLPIPAPATTRGVICIMGKLIGLNLNSVAATTIFTLPAAGFTRCIVTKQVLDNFSTAATTVSISYGASGTPTDWNATATMAGAATGKFIKLEGGGVANGSATYGPGTAFVANVTIPQGVAATCDITAYGFYE